MRLGDVCEPTTGIRDPRRTPSEPFYYISCVDNRTKRITSPSILLGANAPSRARQIIRTNDVLVATTRPNLNAVAMVPSELDNQIFSTGFCVLRSNGQVESGFIFAYVQSPEFIQTVSELVKGALYPAVTDKQVRDIWLPLPPLAEQKRIVAILQEQMAAVERARADTEAQLAAITADVRRGQFLIYPDERTSIPVSFPPNAESSSPPRCETTGIGGFASSGGASSPRTGPSERLRI